MNYISVNVPEDRLSAVYALLAGTAVASIARGLSVQAASNLAQSASPVEENTAPTGEVDAAGTPFDPARHTGTKVKSGLWRLKTGVARLPGEELPVEGAGSPNVAAAGASQSSGSTSTGGAPVAVEEDDEFAAFAAAAAPAKAVARTWTDADLSKLANQAATKLGSPDKVKATIAKHVPEGLTPHSRNIPADKREAFAVDLESVAGIEYAG